jgi:ribosome-binding protein aMBF1 (putative translation factor)
MNFNDLYKKILEDNPEIKKIIEDKDNKFYSDVSNLISEARIHAGLTQEKLAAKLKTKQSSIARIERGTSLPSLSFLFKIAKALDTYLIAPKFGFMEKQTQTENYTIFISSEISPYSSSNDFIRISNTPKQLILNNIN